MNKNKFEILQIDSNHFLKQTWNIYRVYCIHVDEVDVLLNDSNQNSSWSSTKRGKWPRYDVDGHEDDFNRRFRLKNNYYNLSVLVVKMQNQLGFS